MKMMIMTVITALPLMALGQTAEPQQTQTQTKETQATAPAKGKKTHAQEPSKPQAKPETGTVRGQTNVKGRAQDVNRNEPGARSSTSQTNGREEHESNDDGEQGRVQIASQRSVQSWATSERILRPAIRGEPFPVDREHVLRVRGWLLGRG